MICYGIYRLQKYTMHNAKKHTHTDKFKCKDAPARCRYRIHPTAKAAMSATPAQLPLWTAAPFA